MDALSMGGYGVYVWGCFALTLVVVASSDWRARRRHKAVYRDIEVRIKAMRERE